MIFARTGHVIELTASLLPLGDSSLVYLPQSPPPVAVLAAEDFLLLPTPLSRRFLPCPLRAALALQKPPLPRQLSLSMLLPRRGLHRETIPPRSLIRPHPPLRRLVIRLSDSLSAFGSHLYLDALMHSDSAVAAAPAVDYGFIPGGAPRPSARRAHALPRVVRPRPPLAVVTVVAPATLPASTVPIRPAATASSLW